MTCLLKIFNINNKIRCSKVVNKCILYSAIQPFVIESINSETVNKGLPYKNYFG